jgi:hypothetical protein
VVFSVRRSPRLELHLERVQVLVSEVCSCFSFPCFPIAKLVLAKPGGFGAVAKNPNYPDDAQPDMNNPPVPPTGSANPPFKPFQEKEERTGITTEYENISCQPEYRGSSFEVSSFGHVFMSLFAVDLP